MGSHGALVQARAAAEFVKVPDGLDDAEVAAVILNYVTAYQMIQRTAQLAVCLLFCFLLGEPRARRSRSVAPSARAVQPIGPPAGPAGVLLQLRPPPSARP